MAKPLSSASTLFGSRVRQTRTELSWSQTNLADQAGLHWTYIGQVERGERNISLRNIAKLAAALSVDPADLVAGVEPW
jgi:transcriptional regulator with XRE-family HTH domain